jgi:hypothetical protein
MGPLHTHSRIISRSQKHWHKNLATALVLGVQRIKCSSNEDKRDDNGDKLDGLKLVEFGDAMIFL